MGNVRVSGSEQVECDANSKSEDKVISQERLYLPEFVLGKRVLVTQGATTYLADNSDLQSDKATVSFHSSPSMDDRLERVAAYGSVVTGELSNGWLKVEIQNTQANSSMQMQDRTSTDRDSIGHPRAAPQSSAGLMIHQH